MHTISIGTSGFNYHDWKGTFYPQTLPTNEWLPFYAKTFSTVEVNATFYHAFNQDVYEHWYQETPKDFLFTLKGPRIITHTKRLKNIADDIQSFFKTAQVLKEKLHITLWQFPHTFTYSAETRQRLADFLTLLPKKIRHAIEFRNDSWFDETVYQLLREQHIGFVINDSSIFPTQEIITTDFAYIRFHGPGKLYSSLYNNKQLQQWAVKARRIAQTSLVYMYFNNDVSAYAITNALTLKNLLE